jgi:hypothetical protein
MNTKRLRLVMEESTVDGTPGHLVILEYWHVDPAKIKKVCNSRFFWNACEVQQSGTENIFAQSKETEMVRPTNMARVEMMVTNMKASIEQEKKIEQFPLSLNMVHISSANNYIVMSCCNGPVLQTLLEDVDSVMEYIKLTDELEVFVASIRSSNSTPATKGRFGSSEERS